MGRLCKYLITAAILMTASVFSANAQFKEEAFSQNYSDPSDTTATADSTEALFSFKEYFGGLSHKREERIGVLIAGSSLFVGGAQIYNKQYWKLPVIYGGIAGGIAGGIIFNNKYKDNGDSDYKTLSSWFFAGAGLVYWASLMDGAYNYNKEVPHQPGKATLYSVLLPGLGQAYNGEYWKIPIYYGLMVGSFHFYLTNRKNYQKYQAIYRSATTDEDYDGPVSASTAQYYRNTYRRYRDYSIVALMASYLLQVIDANVFSYMRDFDLGDDIEMSVNPTIINNQSAYAFNPNSSGFGIRVGFTF